MKLLVLIVMFMKIFDKGRSDNEVNDCENIKEEICSLCLQIPECSWCTSKNYSHGRCNKVTKHIEQGCPKNQTINPKQRVTLVNASDTTASQIFPRKVKIKARVGEPVTFKVNVRSIENYPVDLYFLLDLSNTMKNDLGNLRLLAGNLTRKLKELTKRHRLGFGSFVDKVIPPFVKQELINKSFNPSERPPFNYRHELDFTDQQQLFQETINNQTNSRSQDLPEASLDALMQVAACESELGWNPVNTTRRIVLLATDAPFHLAGEGRFGGIPNPNDGKCHLTKKRNGVKEYHGLHQDYPTVNQVYKKLRESRIQPIFAVSQSGKKYFKQLAETWRDLGATYEELSLDSNNIIELVERSYKGIVSRVFIKTENTEDIDVQFKTDCGNRKIGTNICQGIGLGETVSFNVTLTVNSCSAKTSSFKILANAFGEVMVDVDTICSCGCEDDSEYNSSLCSNNGNLTCGHCMCDNGMYGRRCHCDSRKSNPSLTNVCKRTNTSKVDCEGHGECDCNECKCHSIENTDSYYYGKYCQCSDFNCHKYKGEICGGKERGSCKCGKCECKRSYVGYNCGTIDCSIESEKCYNGKDEKCSGHGKCNCGKCDCEPFYEGDHCERCPTCTYECADLKKCVRCEIFGEKSQHRKICDDCPQMTILQSIDQLKELKYPVICQVKDSEGCKYYFTYGERKEENATKMFVVLKKGSQGIQKI
ncbi:integrin beta-2-like isoform X2 [Xenia sp. Carnegie-2017]|uniref:integrin beta-2-like isoform X2 n=1 Tax=Xenia sp. Carnegie-2017 TaxID=2897299 RepID=UPI001F033FC3|nr:integrin beta-2-like isoform X2 [Xenia sp. Carnegie-2017]